MQDPPKASHGRDTGNKTTWQRGQQTYDELGKTGESDTGGLEREKMENPVMEQTRSIVAFLWDVKLYHW